MKKILSITLALAIVMSLFCCVPASAASLKLELPYVFEDFEDRAQSVMATEISEENKGYNSKYAGVYEQSTKDKNYYLRDSAGTNQSVVLKAGEKLQISLMVRLDQKMSRAGVGFLLYCKGASDTSGAYSNEYVELNKTDTTNWQKVTREYVADEETTISRIILRFGTSAGDNLAETDTAVTDSTKVYYVDNYELKVVPAELGSDVVPFEDFTDSDNQISCNTYESMTQADGTTGNVGVYSITKATREVSKWVYATTEGGDLSKNFAAGDKIKLSMDVKLGQALQADRVAGIHLYFRYVDPETSKNAALGCTATIPNVSDTTNWQHIEAELDVPFAVTTTKSALYFARGTSSTQSNKHADGTDASADNPQVYYIDNVSITVTTAADLATVAKVTDAAATRKSETEIGLGYTFTSDLTDASIVKLVATEGTTKSYLYTYQASEFASNAAVALPTGAENKNLSLEIVPVASNGYVGETVTVAVPAYQSAPAIEGITLTQASGSVTVATDTALTNAKLIFVSYDANNKLVDWESVDVTLAAQGTQAYAPVSLTAGAKTKAMLWQDMTKCIPLADMIQY